MRTILKRPATTFVLGAVLVLAAVGGRAAVAALDQAATVDACYKTSNGSLYLIGASSQRSECQPGDVPISWNAEGPAGPPGEKGDKGDPGEPGAPFDGTFESPNHLYSISVTDAGIRLRSVFGGEIEMAGPAMTLRNPGGPTTIGGIPLKLDSVFVTLGPCGGGLPVARLNDPVVAVMGPGLITGGSPFVRAC